MSPDAAVTAMRNVARSLRELSKVPARVAHEASEDLSRVLQDQFGAETDPYGKPWAPLKPQTIDRKQGDPRILRRSDAMIDSLTVRPMSGAGLSITFERAYAAFHQIGTKWMAARPLLPRAGLPESWRKVLAEASDRVFGRWAEVAR